MKIKIGLKILLSFLIIIILVGMVSAIGILGMGNIDQSYRLIIHENLPVTDHIQQAHNVILEQVAAVRGFMVYKDEEFSTLYDELQSSVTEIYKGLDDEADTKESQAFLLRIMNDHEAYDKGVAVIMDLVRENKINEAIAYGDTIKEYVKSMKQTMEEWTQWVEKDNQKIVQDTENSMQQRKNVLLLIVGISLIGAAVIGYYLTRSIARPVISITKVAEKIAEGDLTQVIPVIRSRDEIHALGTAFTSMVTNLRNLITSVNDASQELVASSEQLSVASDEVAKVSEQIATTVSELAQGASDQALSSEKGNARIKETLEGLTHIADEMVQSENIMGRARQVVGSGDASVQYQAAKVSENQQMSNEIASAIAQLSQQSQQIGQILEVIRGIAEQTNLLSLNAAIEAARAGEAGRGFAVVADEIGKLAVQSATSVKEIDNIILQVQTGIGLVVTKVDQSKVKVVEQSESINKTVAAFNDIESVVESLGQSIKTVAEMSNALSKNAVQAGDAISDIASVAEQSAASTEEVAASTEEQTSTIHQIAEALRGLTTLANNLQAGINRFNI